MVYTVKLANLPKAIHVAHRVLLVIITTPTGCNEVWVLGLITIVSSNFLVLYFVLGLFDKYTPNLNQERKIKIYFFYFSFLQCSLTQVCMPYPKETRFADGQL